MGFFQEIGESLLFVRATRVISKSSALKKTNCSKFIVNVCLRFRFCLIIENHCSFCTMALKVVFVRSFYSQKCCERTHISLFEKIDKKSFYENFITYVTMLYDCHFM